MQIIVQNFKIFCSKKIQKIQNSIPPRKKILTPDLRPTIFYTNSDPEFMLCRVPN